MEPIFDPDYLRMPNDEDEVKTFKQIRDHYLPEVILAYNSALYFAGHSLSRKVLVQCMDLAQKVAQNNNLTSAFVESGRMREMVNAFAMDSQALLLASEQGKNRGKTGTKREKGIDMWSIQWKPNEKGVDVDASR
jgi:nuclear pore complex protein Nup107